MANAYLGLGSNQGNREAQLRTAIHKIEEQIGKVISLSAFYITKPWGFHSEHKFLNAALCVATELSPLQLLDTTQAIERELGRIQKSVSQQYADRPIDIDLLLYDDLIMDETSPSGQKLIIPHPLMTRRDFVMRPLAEIAPSLRHPSLGETMETLLKRLETGE